MEEWNLTPKRILRALFWLRVVSIALQGTVFLIAWLRYADEIQIIPLGIALAILWLFNVIVHWRLHKPWPATEPEVAIHILFDVIQFTLVLYFTGGASNPFVSLYLLPVALAAAALPISLAVMIGIACTLAYSLLLAIHEPMVDMGHHLSGNWNLHIWGMWLNFLLAAVLLILFVGMLAGMLRRHEREIARARERTLRDEGILAVGTLAAGAAHQLGTPLSTMNLLVESWLDYDEEPIRREDLEILARQVTVCRTTLHEMLEQVREARGEAGHRVILQRYLDDCLERWQVTRPDIRVAVDTPTGLLEWTVRNDVTLAQALTNLLNNAADASIAAGDPRVEVKAWISDGNLHCQIQDFGSGLSNAQAATAQRMFRSSKAAGMGIGLALSNSTVERLDGEVRFHPNQDGGLTWLQLPLASLESTAEKNHATTSD